MRIVSLVHLPAADAERIRAVDRSVQFVDAGGRFAVEYADTWPAATVARYVPGAERGSRAERDALLADADIVIAGFPFPVDLAARAPRLQWLHQTPAGASNLRRGDIWGSAVRVTTSRGHGETTAIAEYALAGMLHFLKGFDRAAVDRQRGAFGHREYRTRSAETRTLTVIGAGGIGQELARLAGALGMRVLGTRRDAAPRDGDAPFERLEPPPALPALLADSDIVAVCCQWTPETTGLLDAAAFARMRPGAIVVNVARGEIVDETALLDALDSGHLRGAVLDVFTGEFDGLPPQRLWHHPRVLLTPHTSAQADASRRQSTDLFIDNLRRFLAGQALHHEVDWARGY